jgi:endonuclease/exonuclease/phosphatase family metal-dependent hydrolase
LRVVTYNVRHLRDDADAVARVVQALDPDVLCLQETPRHPRWRARLARLARESGLLYACGGRPAGNCAVFTHLRVDVKATAEFRFTKHPRLHRRGMAVAVVRKGGAPVAVGSVHLGLAQGERLLHVEEALAAFAEVGAPYAVLAGDLNEPPGGPTWSQLTSHFTDAWSVAPTGREATFRATRPTRRIDAVLASPGVDVQACGAPEPSDDLLIATDHLPVVADLLLPR